jgi:hypothetical protein
MHMVLGRRISELETGTGTGTIYIARKCIIRTFLEYYWTEIRENCNTHDKMRLHTKLWAE